MLFTVRFMRRQDIPQVTEIDREAFPNEWPPTNFARELVNKLAYYVVAYETQQADPKPANKPALEGGTSGFLNRLQNLFSRRQTPQDTSSEKEPQILGYAGMWIMADEAHITSIASNKNQRHQGIGEGLLICLIEMAMKYQARIVTLEVRVSNQTAQNLYYKFGFDNLGNRKGYYLDNKEDAVIMSTEYIGSPSFREKFTQVKKAFLQKWGTFKNEVSIN